MPRLSFLLALLCAGLAGCGGMNRAVGVLPNTMDDLARRTEPMRPGQQPGDEALSATR